MAQGTITQVIGSTFDAQFAESDLPEIYNAITVDADTPAGKLTLVGEVQQHLGGGRVRCVALGSTDGLRRSMTCTDTGQEGKTKREKKRKQHNSGRKRREMTRQKK
eukprot:TRINITY_DN20549_c0_g1_i2.p4 TRINITY_DN20549_c0_g1~~TRINITY_DN20549_c0_g1_i2.p4  ORF type:complete len:106 (-),score=17.00 TRINITY_DN20549_c0_g1_i2:10-327(-)